jgi:hypothetical protein
MKKSIKAQILEYVESLGDEGASYTQITRFAHELKYGVGSYEKNPNRRGWFSAAFSGNWVYSLRGEQFNRMKYRIGYLIKKRAKSGWLEKQANSKYKTVRQ